MKSFLNLKTIFKLARLETESRFGFGFHLLFAGFQFLGFAPVLLAFNLFRKVPYHILMFVSVRQIPLKPFLRYSSCITMVKLCPAAS